MEHIRAQDVLSSTQNWAQLRADKKELTSDLKRKDKALEEMSAKIILLKKSNLYFGGTEDDEWFWDTIACDDMGIGVKKFKRWKINIENKRRGPITTPANK